MSISVLLAEDQRMVLGALGSLLGLEPDIDVVVTGQRYQGHSGHHVEDDRDPADHDRDGDAGRPRRGDGSGGHDYSSSDMGSTADGADSVRLGHRVQRPGR